MIGYGELVLEAARSVTADVRDLRPASVFAAFFSKSLSRTKIAKLARNVDRFGVSPVLLAGRSADIVHVVDPGNALYLNIIQHRTSIVTVHDMIPYLAATDRLKGFRPSRTGRLLMSQTLKQLRRVDRIICVSEASRSDLLEISDIDPNRVTVIHNAVFQAIGPASEGQCCSFRRRHGIPDEVPFVLHVGRNFYKNRAMVFETIALLRQQRPDVHLVVVGALEPELAARVSHHGLAEVLHVLPYVQRDEMGALYTTASVLLFPSVYEGFGYPVLEAQMCGTPVVCSNAGSLPEVAGRGAVLVPADDRTSFARELNRLFQDPCAVADLAQRGTMNIRRFERSRWLENHSNLYRTIA